MKIPIIRISNFKFWRRREEPPTVSFEQQRREFLAQSVAHPTQPLGWLDSVKDGATCSEPVPRELTETQKRKADAKQRRFVEFYRNGRCSAK